MHPENPLHEAHAIGGYEGETPLSMAAAYSAFANGGYYTEPYVVTKVVFSDGETVTNQKETKQVMSSATAYMITNMLQDAAAYGIDSGKYKNINGVPYAGKTGTANFDEETKQKFNLPDNAVNHYWVCGYNTQYAIGVWYGYPSIHDGYNKLASMQHTKFFQAVAKGIFVDKTDFTMPDTVKKVKIETGSATLKLPSEYTPSQYIKEELFVAGTEPTEKSTRFAKLSDVSNLTATTSGSNIILSWNAIQTPDALNKDVIRSQNRSAFAKDNALESYVNSLYNQNLSILGNLGYNIYVKTNDGLTLIGRTEDTTYTVSGQYGDVTIVVKASYEKFESNMSDGKTVTAKVTEVPSIPPVTDPEPNPNPEGDSNVQ